MPPRAPDSRKIFIITHSSVAEPVLLRASTVVCLCVALVSAPAHRVLAAQEASNRPIPPTFALVTVSAGIGMMSWWGHTGLLMSQPTGSEPLIFDYGVVDDRMETFDNELTGRVNVYAMARDAKTMMAAWRSLGRTVRVQPLNLTLAERQALFDRLVYDQSPARRVY